MDVLQALTYDTDRKITRPAMGNVRDNYPDYVQYDHIYVNDSEYVGERGEETFLPPESTQPGDIQADILLSTTEVTDHHLLLLYPTTLAFGISSKQWSKLIRDISYRPTVLRHLHSADSSRLDEGNTSLKREHPESHH